MSPFRSAEGRLGWERALISIILGASLGCRQWVPFSCGWRVSLTRLQRLRLALGVGGSAGRDLASTGPASCRLPMAGGGGWVTSRTGVSEAGLLACETVTLSSLRSPRPSRGRCHTLASPSQPFQSQGQGPQLLGRVLSHTDPCTYPRVRGGFPSVIHPGGFADHTLPQHTRVSMGVVAQTRGREPRGGWTGRPHCRMDRPFHSALHVSANGI